MELDTDEANLRADSSRIDGMDLYNDLIAFSTLSPEERGKELPERIVNGTRPAEQAAGEFVYADPEASSESAPEILEGRGNKDFELIGPSSSEMLDQPVSQAAEEPSAFTVEDFPLEMPDKPAPDLERESSFEMAQADDAHKKKSDYLDLNYLLRVTGPLTGFGLAANDASLLVVCSDCGSQSSSEDMFCVTCGGLLDKTETANLEIADRELADLDLSNAPLAKTGLAQAAARGASDQLCDGCDCLVEEGEIFCPSCGAVL
jgi:hypothetical protein